MVNLFSRLKKYYTFGAFAKLRMSAVKRIKPGFTFAEVLISMLLMSIFFVATAKVMTVRQKTEVHENPHGYYECYQSGSLMQHRVDGTNTTIPINTPSNQCEFVPMRGLPFYNIYIVHHR